MVKLRKALPELVYGAYTLLDENNKHIYAYTRILDDKKILVILNFSDKNVMFNPPASVGKVSTVLINNSNDYKIKDCSFNLKPYQAIIVRLK